MGTSHINANPGDFANVVLMPGDPKRAYQIANRILVEYKEVANIRGMVGYTGYTKNGKRVSVMASGMGQPSIGIYSYELYTVFGVDTIIRVGTCGAYQKEINLYDIIIGATASTTSNWAAQYGVTGTWSANADYELIIEAEKSATELGVPHIGGNILSSDIFYDSDQDSWKRWADLNVLGVEMEAYALYGNAAKLHKRALAILTVTDHFVNKGRIVTPEERETGCRKMVDVALPVAEKFAKESR